MFGKKKYKLNSQTLAYEVYKSSAKKRFYKGLFVFLMSIVAFQAYYVFYVKVLKLELPKTIHLKQKYVNLSSKLEVMEQRFGNSSRALLELQMRDNNVYRPIFGMEEVSSDLRNSGIGGTDNYARYNLVPEVASYRSVEQMADILYKKAFVQSRSFDEVEELAHRADQMAMCVPALPPVALEATRLSSYFGYRSDPFSGKPRFHQGLDLSGNRGEPIYCTGNGVVEKVGFEFHGYGNYVIVDHGFGYKTRYAHLQYSYVKTGDVLSRGEQLGVMGNSGRSRGPHLHYEVIYRENRVNPLNYYDSNLKGAEYRSMVKQKPKPPQQPKAKKKKRK